MNKFIKNWGFLEYALTLIGVLLLLNAIHTEINKVNIKRSIIELNKDIGSPLSDSLILSTESISDAQVMQIAGDKIERLELIKQFSDSSPLPMLAKELKDSCSCFVPTYFNNSFVQMFLIPNNINPDTYLGTSEYDNWPDTLARDYEQQDFDSLRSGVIEFETDFVVNGKIQHGRFTKWSDNKSKIYMYYLTTKKNGNITK